MQLYAIHSLALLAQSMSIAHLIRNTSSITGYGKVLLYNCEVLYIKELPTLVQTKLKEKINKQKCCFIISYSIYFQ